MKKQQAINNRQLTMTNSNALFAFITPAGISLIAVRGFFASKFLSSQRLKAIAADRAKTMQRITSMKSFTIDVVPPFNSNKEFEYPLSAKIQSS